jgi:hypothetical protein
MSVEDADGVTYETMDTTAIAKDIGAELFGLTPKPTVEEPTEGVVGENNDPAVKPAAPSEASPVVPEKPAPEVKLDAAGKPIVEDKPAIVPGENKEAIALPKSWKKDMAPVWEKADPAVKAYIVEREAQFMRGFQQYANGHNAWDALIRPFAPLLQQNPNVNPVQLMQGLMQTHLTLLNPNQPPAEKAAMVQGILNEYGIKLDGITPVAADYTALQQRLQRAEADNATLREQGRREAAARYQAGVNQQLTEVEKFSADPKNEYFAEVGNDILRLIKSNSASSLAEAYEIACWANPAVRAKMIAKQQSEKPALTAQPRGKNGTFVNIEDSGSTPTIRVKKLTMDQTIDSVVAKHYDPTKH